MPKVAQDPRVHRRRPRRTGQVVLQGQPRQKHGFLRRPGGGLRGRRRGPGGDRAHGDRANALAGTRGRPRAGEDPGRGHVRARHRARARAIPSESRPRAPPTSPVGSSGDGRAQARDARPDRRDASGLRVRRLHGLAQAPAVAMHPRGLHARLYEVHRLAGRRLGSRVGHPRQLAPAKRPTDGRAGFLQGDLLARRVRQPRVRQEAHQDARRVQAAPQPLRQPHLHRHRQQPFKHVRAILLGVRTSAPGGRLQPAMRDVRAGQGGETRADAPVRRVRGLAPRRVRRVRPDRLGHRPRRRGDCHLIRVRAMPRRREERPEEAHRVRVRARDAGGPGGSHEAPRGGKLHAAPRHAAPQGQAVRPEFRPAHPRPRRVGE